VVAAVVMVAASLCGVGWWRLSRRGSPISGWRVAAAAGGLLSVALALLSPLDRAAHVFFSAHMVQHLLLTMVAAPRTPPPLNKKAVWLASVENPRGWTSPSHPSIQRGQLTGTRWRAES
jgi:hypothetical protein